MRTHWLTASLCLALACSTLAAEPEKTLEQRLEQARAVAQGAVMVEYTLKYDAGRPPRGALVRDEQGRYRDFGPGFVYQQRPVEIYSYLIGDDVVLSQDLPVSDRFIEKIEVRFADDTVSAKRVAWTEKSNAVYLKLARPLRGATPITFDAKLPGPYTGLVAGGEHGVWGVTVLPFKPEPVVSRDLGEYLSMPREAVIVDPEGRAVGMSMSAFGAIPGDWKGDPNRWPRLEEPEYRDRLLKAKSAADAGIVRVTLNFRSPKGRLDPAARFRGGDDETVTEMHLIGVLLADGQVIVPASLKPDVTARLERITIFPDSGEPLSGDFVASLKDYGALVAKVAAPPGSGIALSTQPITGFCNQLLPHANAEVRGEERIVYMGHTRIENFSRGWGNKTQPVVPDDEQDTFIFDPASGNLVAFPIAHRAKFIDPNRAEEDPEITAAVDLAHVIADLSSQSDSSNIPLSESEENRIAWLGVVMQPLDQELARANKVAELTNDGESGALVSFVYPGSPAEAMGVQPGWIILRLHVPGRQQPVDVRVNELAAGLPGFPWDRLDDIPEDAYEQIPGYPWPSSSNALTDALTEAGFGTKVKIEFSADGAVTTKEFTVEQSPTHYDSAPRYKCEALGITVRDATFEVRKYFQLADAEPCVIISKVEPGSKASIAGIRHFELVTMIGETPVNNVKEFESLIGAGGELKLTVKRMTRTRQVPVRLDPAPAPGDGSGSDEPSTDE